MKDFGTTTNGDRPMILNTATDWAPPTRLECLRCGRWFTTLELPGRCPHCGFRETVS